MKEPINLAPYGFVTVEMGLANSVVARDLLAQIANLILYNGTASEEIVFRIDQSSVSQALEWGITSEQITSRLEDLGVGGIQQLFAKIEWEEPKELQRPGDYSHWFTFHKGFWTNMRVTQTFWLLRSFDRPLNSASLPNSMLQGCKREFGSWTKGIKFAGYNPSVERYLLHKEKWTNERIIRELQELKSSGVPIHGSYLQKNGYMGLNSAMRGHFGSWSAAISAAGFDPNQENKALPTRLSREEVLSKIILRQSRGEKLGVAAVSKHDSNFYSSARYHFGSWREALSAAGIDPDTILPIFWTKESIIEAVKRIKANGEPIFTIYLQHHHLKVLGAMVTHFGSWEEAVRASGFNPFDETPRPDLLRSRAREWSKEKVIKELQRLKAQGEPIFQNHLRRNYTALWGALSHYYRRSWADAVIEAGFDPRQETPSPGALGRRPTGGKDR